MSSQGTAAVAAGDGPSVVGGRYRLLAVVGAGGMGRVWRAHDDLLDREVAVKEITAGPDPEQTIREARAAAGLDHPHVVRIYDVVQTSSQSWIVMEYVAGRSLHDVLRQDGPLAHREAARIGAAMLEALRAAHAAGILHRDVKPHNVIVGADGRVVLTDFGLATRLGGPAPTGVLLGSPHYVAPERLRDQVSSAQTDLWSLGATLYAAVEGRPPFVRPTVADSLAALMAGEPHPPQRPGPLHPVIAGLLSKDPDTRTGPDVAYAQMRAVASRAIGVFQVPAPRSAPETRGTPPFDGTPALDGTPETPSALETPSAPESGSLPETAGEPVPRSLPGAGATPGPDSSPETPGLLTSRDLPGAAAEKARATSLAALGVPVAVPARVAARRPVRTQLVLAGAGVVLAGVAGTVFAVSAHHDPAPRTVAAPAAVVAPVGQCGSRPVAGSAVPKAVTLPSGWIWHRDVAGFALPVPGGWSRSVSGTVTCFGDPAGMRKFTVDTEAPLTREPLKRWQDAETRGLKDGTLPGYQRVSMGVLLLKRGGADWEYSWQPATGPRLHTRRVLVATSTSKAYLLQWTTTEQDWALNVPVQQRIVSTLS